MTRGPVLVTGASSGIGLAIARRLAGEGHRVYATARKPADLQALAAIPRVSPVAMDVRDAAAVSAAAAFITAQGQGLYGVVNNAGLGDLGPFSCWTDEEMRTIFDVNVFGPHRVTNAMLPLLLAARGRVVNIGSQGGMITSRYFGPYTMTKHALEAYTQSLHLELAPHGVNVSIVQPGGIETDIGDNSAATNRARFERAQAPFAEEAAQVLAALGQASAARTDEPESATNRKPSPPAIVADAVVHALFSDTPKLRYLVGTRWEGDRVVTALLDRLLDENDSPSHGLTRDELVARLDERIAARGR